jgi:hypothetical protein
MHVDVGVSEKFSASIVRRLLPGEISGFRRDVCEILSLPNIMQRPWWLLTKVSGQRIGPNIPLELPEPSGWDRSFILPRQ